MPKNRFPGRRRPVCQEFRFMEVEFPRPIQPRLVIQFSDGLSLLLEDDRAIDLAAAFIVGFRAHEAKIRKGGAR